LTPISTPQEKKFEDLALLCLFDILTVITLFKRIKGRMYTVKKIKSTKGYMELFPFKTDLFSTKLSLDYEPLGAVKIKLSRVLF
jgi:hypothetical protein